MDCQEQSLQFIIDSTKRIGSDRVTSTGLQLRDTNHVETIEQKSAHFLLIGRTSRIKKLRLKIEILNFLLVFDEATTRTKLSK